jgi:hypothetical protein
MKKLNYFLFLSLALCFISGLFSVGFLNILMNINLFIVGIKELISYQLDKENNNILFVSKLWIFKNVLGYFMTIIDNIFFTPLNNILIFVLFIYLYNSTYTDISKITLNLTINKTDNLKYTDHNMVIDLVINKLMRLFIINRHMINNCIIYQFKFLDLVYKTFTHMTNYVKILMVKQKINADVSNNILDEEIPIIKKSENTIILEKTDENKENTTTNEIINKVEESFEEMLDETLENIINNTKKDN